MGQPKMVVIGDAVEPANATSQSDGQRMLAEKIANWTVDLWFVE